MNPMTTFLDLPVHALAVHAPVVLVPLLALLALVYLFVPPLRRTVGWAVAILTLIAPAAVYGAIWSGDQLADFAGLSAQDDVVAHRGYGYRLLWILIGLVPVWWLFAGLDRGRRSAAARGGDAPAGEGDGGSAASEDPAAKGRRVVMVVFGLIALVLLALAAWMAFEAWHSGADMRWADYLNS